MSGRRARRVVFVETTAKMGGVQFSTVYLADRLNGDDWTPVVICPSEGPLTEVCRSKGIAVSVVPTPSLLPTSFTLGSGRRIPNLAAWFWNPCALAVTIQRLRRALREQRADLVVTKGLPSHFGGGAAAWILNLPCIWHAQDFISESHFGIYRRLFGRAATGLATKIIADGAAIQQQLPASVQFKTEVIHNGVDPEPFRVPNARDQVRTEFGLPRHALVIGSVGRFTPWKGQLELLRSFVRVAEMMPHAYLLLVGAAVFDNTRYENELRGLAEQSGLRDRVTFAGFRDDLGRMFSAMDVLAYTSLEKDTSPLAILSAMAAGLPIVAFEIAGITEVLTPGHDALLISTGNLDALTQALLKLLNDEALRETLGRAARHTLDARFSLEQHHRSMHRAFREALGPSHETSSIVSASTVCS